MNFSKNTITAITSLFILLYLATLIFFLRDGSHRVGGDSNMTSSSGQSNATITIHTNVQNNIYGNSDVETTITNNMTSNTDYDIRNDIDNLAEGNGESNFSNTIDNQFEGKAEGTLSNSLKNYLNGSGGYGLDNNVLNNLGVNVDVKVTNDVGNETNGRKNDGGGGNNGEGNEGGQKPTPELVWGIDSASETTEDLYACVRENFGDPEVFGRYLITRDGVSRGLTAEQVDLIQSKGDYILPIYNNFSDATGFENGVNQANAAIKGANDLGVPEGVALFADIEPTYPVDSEFIRGWFETMASSKYESGIYGIFDPDRALYKAYNQAAERNGNLLKENYIWTASPNVGITTQAEAPDFAPEAPDNSLALGWQYGIDAEACNIDTNLFDGDLLEVLWKP
ncbi:DUF1906 domain-containing protein [Rossellomorea aquimaris]|uniref:glycoside hydrolase domain-containing protein n=1 Tax=Rossellomorea aquimaris TaxID=189382 RepID=UPI001CD26716|nr:glycoside hydrolase domain-containing protein [Rossellomorea aquimaris]MCA1056992.1 DUF1906 domain-containing protein [Rossellomorea aquimaris]